jgi:hypothetical protein
MASKIKVNAIEVSTGSEIKIGTAVTVTSSSVSATSFQGDGANLTNITGANITGTIPESALSNVNLDTLNANIAMLGFKVAVNGSLTKYSLVDQVIDEYEDASGIDASASTNETLTSGVYYGGSTTNPTQDADAATTDGAYKVYKWTDTGSTGTFTPNVTGSYEYLVVAGGGAGGRESYSFGTGGGGGAGGLLANNAYNLTLSSGTAYTITVGAGGAAQTPSNGYVGNNGANSSITGSGLSAITAIGGGGGGGGTSDSTNTTGNGGSGGGAGGSQSPSHGSGNGADRGTGTAGQGNIGGWGDRLGSPTRHYAGGGGGAGEAGGTDNSTVGTDTIMGGDGLQNDITGSNVWYAGGGGGCNDQSYATARVGLGGDGGGGDGSNYAGSNAGGAGTANTGGGGGGAGNNNAMQAGAGGSGVVILRVASIATGSNLTLQSVSTTASSVPTKADLVLLIENSSGAATLNTDIKGYISRDGSTFTQGTLVDEGSWGTNKKIVAFHNLDISGQSSGTSMKYKITTHNQSAGSKETRIHATSFGWS